MAIYLDYNASAPLRPEALEAIGRAMAQPLGNPSSVHWAGRRARALVDDARRAVAHLIDAPPADVVFTSGGTEANNLAVLGVAGGRGAGHAVTSAVEHASVLGAFDALAARGIEVTRVGVDGDGRVDVEEIERALREDTLLVSIGLANNEVGTVQPIAEIAARTRRRNVPLHVDAVQAVGKIPVAVDVLGADLMSLSAHKLGGPQGAGALFVRQEVRACPLFFGGPQEWERRPGTENVLGIVGFGAAATEARTLLDEGSEGQRQARLVERAWEGIRATVPEALRNSPREGAVPNTLNVSIPGTEVDALVIGFDLCDVAVSAGSACSAGSLEPSHVLLSMGRSELAARSGLRLSIGPDTTLADIEGFLAALPHVVNRCRSGMDLGAPQ